MVAPSTRGVSYVAALVIRLWLRFKLVFAEEGEVDTSGVNSSLTRLAIAYEI